MEKVFSNSEDKYVKTTVVYADKDKGHLFTESDKKTKINKDVVKELFLKGIVINLSDELLKPTSYKITSGYAVLTCADATANKEFYSSEKVGI